MNSGVECVLLAPGRSSYGSKLLSLKMRGAASRSVDAVCWGKREATMHSPAATQITVLTSNTVQFSLKLPIV